MVQVIIAVSGWLVAWVVRLEQKVVDISPLPLALAKCCPFAISANFRQKILLQNGVADVLTQPGKGKNLFGFENFAVEMQNSLIKMRDFCLVVADSILIMRTLLAKAVASHRDLHHLVGLSQKSCHILNESLAISFALEEQSTQSVMWTQKIHLIRSLVIFHWHSSQNCTGWRTYLREKLEINVEWFDANNFCLPETRFSQLTGKQPVLTGGQAFLDSSRINIFPLQLTQLI